MSSRDDSEVLIVGAGPVGLVTASELARLGITVTIIDRRTKPTRHSKANVLWPRSLELLARLGLSDGLVCQAHQIQTVRFRRGNSIAAVHSLADLPDTSFPFALTLPQPATERHIEQHLRERRVEVERGSELVDFEVTDDCVEAGIRKPDGVIERRRFGWLVGVDGSGSLVRQQAGLSFDGETVPVVFTLLDAFAMGIPSDEGAYYFGKQGSLAIAPVGADLFRFATSAFALDDVGSAQVALQGLLDEFGVAGQITSIRYAAQFQAQVRQASAYRHGRIMLAGDAAHIGTPASGQGMNTGIQDAVALGWRLGHVILGHLSQEALDHYEQERRVHVDAVLTATRRQTAQVDEHAAPDPVDDGVPSVRQMTQLDTCYGGGAVRVPPLPNSVASRAGVHDSSAPAVILYPGSIYNAATWRAEVLRVRVATPSYFQVVDLAGAAIAPRYVGILGSEAAALLVRPDQHLQLRIAPSGVSQATFTSLGWRR